MFYQSFFHSNFHQSSLPTCLNYLNIPFSIFFIFFHATMLLLSQCSTICLLEPFVVGSFLVIYINLKLYCTFNNELMTSCMYCTKNTIHSLTIHWRTFESNFLRGRMVIIQVCHAEAPGSIPVA